MALLIFSKIFDYRVFNDRFENLVCPFPHAVAPARIPMPI